MTAPICFLSHPRAYEWKGSSVTVMNVYLRCASAGWDVLAALERIARLDYMFATVINLALTAVWPESGGGLHHFRRKVAVAQGQSNAIKSAV